MAAEAARIVLTARGIDPTEVSAIIVCTVTPDMLFPATACLVQDRLGDMASYMVTTEYEGESLTAASVTLPPRGNAQLSTFAGLGLT